MVNSTHAAFEEPHESECLRVILFSLATLASLFGNCVMCKATCTFPSKKPLPYHLVTTLAIAEIISTLCLPFPFVYQYVGYWPFKGFACKVTIPLQVLSMFVVTNTLAAIAVYRFFVVFRPSRMIVTDCKITLLLCLLWVLALVTVLPLFIFYKIIVYEGETYCNAEFQGDDLLKRKATEVRKYQIVRFILNFGLPYLIMLASYGAVALKLKRHINRARAAEPAEMSTFGKQQTEEGELGDETGGGGGGGGGGEMIQVQDAREVTNVVAESRTMSRRITEMERDLLKMIYAVILVYVVCYFPYQVHFLFNIFLGYERYPTVGRYKSIIRLYSYLLLSFPSALHPLCYGTMSTFYARAFSKVVLCK